MRVLMVTADVPWPTVGGARTRNAHLAAALAATHEVDVLSLRFDDCESEPPPGISLRTVPWSLPDLHAAAEAGDPTAWDQLFAPGALPYGVTWYASPALSAAVAQACVAARPDVVVLPETAMAQFRHDLPTDTPFVLDLHDVHAVKQARYGDDDQVARLRAFEADAARAAAVTVCVSDREADAARRLLGVRDVVVVPNGVDTSHFLPAPGLGSDDRLVFTGSLHTQENAEGVSWFVHQVLPLIRAERPATVLDVVGSRPTDEIRQLASHPGVRLHADVPDTLPFLHGAGTAVIPLLHGGGTRLKALEAAAAGNCIVSTSVGVEGLPLSPGEHLLVADDAPSFAAAVLRACGEPETRARFAGAARVVASSFDWALLGRRWTAVVESAASQTLSTGAQ